MVHGQDTVCDYFAEGLRKDMDLEASAPFSGSIFDLAENAWIREAAGIPVVKTTVAKKKVTSVYMRLLSAGERLLRVIHHNEGGANKDLAKFTDQIMSLCDKWDR